MLRAYANVPNIKNQFGVDIPVFMINMKGSTRESAIQVMSKKGYKDICAKEHMQEFIDYVFAFHMVEFKEEHEANLCKDDKDVWKMYMKNKYNHIKNIVHLRGKENAVDIYEYPEDYVYAGAYVTPRYDKDGKIDAKNSEVKIYHVHPACHDGMETFELSFDDFKLIQDKIDLLFRQ